MKQWITAMELRILKPYKNESGITFIEILIVIALIMIGMSVVYMTINPLTIRKRGRDEKRISDLSVLDSAISEYVLDTGQYPDVEDTLRTSTTLPDDSSGPLVNSNGVGWIKEDLTGYLVMLPIDPINDATYKYSYQHTAHGYELNAVLEYNLELAQEDNGNNDSVYEIGNILTIL